MIDESISRVGTIGASDTKFVMLNYDTKTFTNWWAEKIGIKEPKNFDSVYIQAGTLLELPVLKAKFGTLENLNIARTFTSKKYPRLKVNLDADDGKCNYEVKCIKYEKAFDYQFKIDINYYRQVQVQMFVSGLKKSKLIVYGLRPADYDFDKLVVVEIDKERIFEFPIEYDQEWIEKEYLPKLSYLCDCLDKNEIPKN